MDNIRSPTVRIYQINQNELKKIIIVKKERYK